MVGVICNKYKWASKLGPMLSTGDCRQDSPVNKPLNPQIKECYGIFEKARWSFKIFCTLYP